jgi:DNA-binding NarL/FixJ family response regulator
VGKSRLAATVLEEAAAESWATLSVRATAGLAGVPLGALRAVLDTAPTSGIVELTAAVERDLLAMRTSQGLFVVVDDGQELDDASAWLLHQLVATDSIVMLATVRSGVQPPVALTGLWKDSLAQRVELGSLNQRETTELLTAVLGGPLAASSAERLWQVTGGNPLYLREVVLASHETQALRLASGEWRWTGEWAKGARLQEIVATRLGRLDPDELTAMEMIAVTGGSLPLELLESLTTPLAIEGLEDRSLVMVETSGRRLGVSIAHPVHAEVIRAGLPPLRERSMRRNLVNAVLATGARRSSDSVRLACWSIESGLDADPITLALGADGTLFRLGLALAARLDEILLDSPLRFPLPPAPVVPHDPALALKLFRAAYEASGGIVEGASLATALTWLGDTAGAEAVLVDLAAKVDEPNDRLRLANSLGWIRFWGRYEVPEAKAVLVEAAEVAEAAAPGETYDKSLLADVYQQLAGIELNTGWPARALVMAEKAAGVLGSDVTNPLVSPVASASLAYLGRCGEALELTDRAMTVALTEGPHDLTVPSLIFARAGALARAGRLEDARELVESCRQLALANDSLDGAASFGTLAGEVLLRQGRPASAARMFRDAAGLLAERDIFGYRPWALTGLARARAAIGDEDGAAMALAESETIGMVPRHYQMSCFQAEIQLLVLRGRTAEAIVRADEAVDWACQGQMTVEEATALDLRQRLAPSAAVTKRLQELAGEVDSRLVATLALHAEGLSNRDPRLLRTACDEFAEVGAVFFASEAAAAAASVHQRRHETRAAQAAARLAREYAAHCEGAVSAFGEIFAGAAASTLTRRERQISALFAGGYTSKEIADRLFVSRRTVEGHLYRVYTKLGVSDRTGLAAALDPTAAS